MSQFAQPHAEAALSPALDYIQHPTFPPLDRETRAGVETACAAYHLNREPQTLRIWACKENGPIRPRRVAGRLMWPTAKLRELCGVAV
jgi:hypothetical protein